MVHLLHRLYGVDAPVPCCCWQSSAGGWSVWSVPAGGMASVAAWLPFVRAAAVGWVPLAHHPVPPTPISRDRGDAVVRADVRVRINVSGHRSVLQRPSFVFYFAHSRVVRQPSG